MNRLRLKQSRLMRWSVGPFAIIAAYLLAALVGSHLPVNREWQPARDGVTIYITDNGWHTGLILPTHAVGVNLGQVFRATDLPNPANAGDWMIFGWGDRDFYLNTPTWADLRPSTALSAFIGSGNTLIHVDHLARPDQAYGPRPIRLSRDQYLRLIRALLKTPRFDGRGQLVPIQGYSAEDVFYPAYGRYNVFRTCNVWTRDVLAEAGVRVGWWTPFSGGVMRWFD